MEVSTTVHSLKTLFSTHIRLCTAQVTAAVQNISSNHILNNCSKISLLNLLDQASINRKYHFFCT